jgi:hypothetical protein
MSKPNNKKDNKPTNIGIQADEIHAQAIAVGNRAKAIVNIVFEVINKEIDSLPEGPDKTIATNAVQALEAEAQKGDQVEASNVSKWLNFLAQTAPDAWEVAVNTFINPVQGLSTVFQKVAKRAKDELAAKEKK